MSDLMIKSNLMIETRQPEYRYIPGDYVGQIYREKIDSRVIERELTKEQIMEHKQYLVCTICKKPCAGTCE